MEGLIVLFQASLTLVKKSDKVTQVEHISVLTLYSVKDGL